MLLMQKVVVCVSTEFILVLVPCNKMKKNPTPRSLRATSIALPWKDRTGKQLESYVSATLRVILIQKNKNCYDKNIPCFFSYPQD